MKFTLIVSMMFAWTTSHAKEFKSDFNKVLIETVQRDLEKDNAEEMKVKPAARGPASVDEDSIENDIQEESKIEKNFKQLGSRDW